MSNTIIIITWTLILIALLIQSIIFVSFRFILPEYKVKVSDVSFQELLLALNAAIQTELDIWERNVFVNKQAITNSNFENYYNEISVHIAKSLSPTFYLNISKYISEDAVISIIGKKTREYLTGKIM